MTTFLMIWVCALWSLADDLILCFMSTVLISCQSEVVYYGNYLDDLIVFSMTNFWWSDFVRFDLVLEYLILCFMATFLMAWFYAIWSLSEWSVFVLFDLFLDYLILCYKTTFLMTWFLAFWAFFLIAWFYGFLTTFWCSDFVHLWPLS